MVSDTIIQPAKLFLKVESEISELQVPELTSQIKNFHKMTCKQARNIVAAYILDLAIIFCTNASQLQLSNSSLLLFQYTYDATTVQIQFEGSKVYIFLINKLTFKPGEVKTIHLNFITNSDLDDNLALAPHVQFIHQLSIRELNIANC